MLENLCNNGSLFLKLGEANQAFTWLITAAHRLGIYIKLCKTDRIDKMGQKQVTRQHHSFLAREHFLGC